MSLHHVRIEIEGSVSARSAALRLATGSASALTLVRHENRIEVRNGPVLVGWVPESHPICRADSWDVISYDLAGNADRPLHSMLTLAVESEVPHHVTRSCL